MLEVAHTGSDLTRIRHPKRSIRPDEPLPLAMHRVSVGLLSRAINDLRRRDDRSFDASVHSARKTLKRLRGQIRLVRDRVGYRTYREENVVIRNTSRTLSGIRDAWVLVETLGDLRDHYGDLLDDTTFVTTDAWLRARHEERHRSVTTAVVNNAIVSLGAARSRFAKYPMGAVIGDDFDHIASGLKRVYRRGLRGYERAGVTRDVDDLHEWRKRVKYLRYQAEFLTPVQPTLIGAQAVELETLGELLGDDHDLALLGATVLENPESCRDDRERWMLLALIHERRASLQAQAFRRGSALYAESPDAFVDRIGAYWDAGRH